MVKWLRCLAFTQESRVQFPVSESAEHTTLFGFPLQVTDLLYQKQSQIEKMVAERSARQMAWERELASVREDAERVKRQVALSRLWSLYSGDLSHNLDPPRGIHSCPILH